MADMFNIAWKARKEGFFDQDKVKQSLNEATYQNLLKAGAYIMRTAKQSMRFSKKSADPGKPPKAHVGLIKEGERSVIFGYDFDARSVVVGPTPINKPTGAPRTLEFGGDVMFTRRWRKGKRGKPGWSWDVSPYPVHISPRPFMDPAMKENLPKFPALWANSVR